MELTEFALRLLLLFFPGIVCFYIVETLTVHQERPTHEVFLRCFVYGILSYLFYALVLALLNITWIESKSGFDFTDEVSITRTLSNSKVSLDVGEISWVTGTAIFLGVIFSFAIARKWPNDFAQWTGISRKFGDANVWSRAFNADDVKWATVRDLEKNMMFSGYVLAFSDVEEVAELFLTQVIVYNECTGAELYRADSMYLSRPKDYLTVEFPRPPVESESAVDHGPPQTGEKSAESIPETPTETAPPPKRRRRRK